MTQDTEDVVARLRKERASLELAFPGLNAVVFEIAADLIQSLSDRIDVLEAENARHVENQRRAFELASKLSRPFDGGSDNHGS